MCAPRPEKGSNVSDLTLTRRRIRAGLYEGILTTRARLKGEPVVELHLPDSSLGEVTLAPAKEARKSWDVQAQIPSLSINEGIQTYILKDAASGATLDSFAVVTGEPLDDDLRTEFALLRAELDMLKRAFRAHVNETGK